MRGTPRIPFTELIADTIACHGLAWSVAYYAKRLTLNELRVFMRAAYLTIGA